MLALTNFLYRRRDPTRGWRAVSDALVIDLRRCTLAGGALGGEIAGIGALGVSEDAKQAARGYPTWYSKGIVATIEEGRLADFMVYLKPWRKFGRYPGKFRVEGRAVEVMEGMTPEGVIGLLGEPFGRSNNEWDSAMILFYEWREGELQWAFDKESGQLETVEFWYEAELAQADACATYGIAREFPGDLRRMLARQSGTEAGPESLKAK